MKQKSIHREIRKAMARRAWALVESQSFQASLKEKVSSTGIRNLLAVAGEAVVLEELLIVLGYQKGRNQIGAKLANEFTTNLQALATMAPLKQLQDGPEKDSLVLVAARDLLANLVKLQTSLVHR